MTQAITWHEITQKEYQSHEQAVRRLPLLQCADYASPVTHDGHFLLVKNDHAIGLCKIHTLYIDLIQRAYYAVMLDRGPVWFDDHGTLENFELFIQSFNKRFPKRFGRKRRLIAEIDTAHDIMIKHGWQKKGAGYETIWLDLTQPTETLHAHLKKNWRGALKKAQASDLTIEWDEHGKTLPFTLKAYGLDKKRRNYPGPSVPFMTEITRTFTQTGNCLIARALKDGNCIAFALILKHGASATYQIGWTIDQGRGSSAHHFILWDAVNVLKQKGYKDFDLGGLNSETANGVGKFKMGMGGALMRGSGLYV